MSGKATLSAENSGKLWTVGATPWSRWGAQSQRSPSWWGCWPLPNNPTPSLGLRPQWKILDTPLYSYFLPYMHLTAPPVPPSVNTIGLPQAQVGLDATTIHVVINGAVTFTEATIAITDGISEHRLNAMYYLLSLINDVHYFHIQVELNVS